MNAEHYPKKCIPIPFISMDILEIAFFNFTCVEMKHTTENLCLVLSHSNSNMSAYQFIICCFCIILLFDIKYIIDNIYIIFV